jgi:hypothetical protein
MTSIAAEIGRRWLRVLLAYTQSVPQKAVF